MAFIRPVCVRADTILAAVMIISYAFIKVLRRKGDKKGKKRNILRNRLIKIKRSEKGWGRFSIVALLVFQTLFFSAFHLLFLNQTSIPKFFSPTRKYPKLMHYLTDTDVQNYNSKARLQLIQKNIMILVSNAALRLSSTSKVTCCLSILRRMAFWTLSSAISLLWNLW